MMTARLMLRRHRWMITSWSVLLIALAGGTVSAYQSTYTTPEQRRMATELAQRDTASTLLYGTLAEPGTPALMFTWEIGAIVTILVAIVAVLLAISLTRASEDDGTMELLRSAGIGPRVPLRSAFAVIALVATILTLGCTAAVGLAVGHVDAVTWAGALAFGCVVGLTFLLVAVLTLVLAQVAPTTTDARLLGFATVTAAFATRAVADTQHIGWLNWLSPLAVRATVRPFLSNRWWVLMIYLLVVLVLAALAEALSDRREYGAGLVRRRDRHDARLNVHSSLGLAGRLARRSIVTWTVAVAGIGTMFSAMGSGVVQQSQEGDVGGFLGSQLGTGDPIAGYFAYCGTLVALLVSAFAVLCVLGARQDERIGRTDHLLTTGRRRWEPLAAQLVVTAAGSAIILVVAGALSAVVAPTAITGTDVALRAFGYTVGQWPAVIAAAGWTALLIGRMPRWHWLAWAPLLVGGTLALLGDLLSIPGWIQTLGIFQHVPDIAVAGTDIRGPLVLVTAAGVACLLGVIGTTQRDVATG
jgi:ABC-2 type transport system permease protein